jgi:hypothetical protein
MKYIVIGKEGLEIKESRLEAITPKMIQEVIGTGASQHWMEFVSGRFHDPSLTIICNEEGRLEQLPSYVRLRSTGEALCGHVLIVADGKDGEIKGLTDKQIEIVKKQVIVSEDGIPTMPAPAMQVFGFDSSEEMRKNLEERHDSLRKAARLPEEELRD